MSSQDSMKPLPYPTFFFFERESETNQAKKKKKVVDVLNGKEGKKKVHLC